MFEDGMAQQQKQNKQNPNKQKLTSQTIYGFQVTSMERNFFQLEFISGTYNNLYRIRRHNLPQQIFYKALPI